MNLSKKIVIPNVLFALILALILSFSGYQRFTSMLTTNYENTALRSAKSALTFLDVENFPDYNQKLLKDWQQLVDTQDLMFIYAIEPTNDYNYLRFIVSIEKYNSNYKPIPRGFIKQTSSAEYKKAYRDIYENGKSYAVVIRDNGISETGDHITVLIPIKDSSNLVKGILCVQRQMTQLAIEKDYFLKSTISITLIVLVAMISCGLFGLKIKLLNPLISLTEGVKEISDGNLDKKLKINTGDEIQTLAENFNTMTDELKTQMANLKKVTAENERIATELNVAKQIQLSMLPKDFFDNEQIELFAIMTPAKEVGGDFYDFYMLDKNHLMITIADVSGKGVPAALFMVAAITHLRNGAASYPNSLKKMIESTNDKLCRNNDGGLFVTAFVGVLELTTGIFRYVNAGHNPPLIRRRGKNFDELPMELNFVLGGWEDWQYIQQEIKLDAGDTIFLYTDGVTESADLTGKFYSLERLKKFLNDFEEFSSAKKISTEVYNSLEKFSDGAEQSDDITMLVVKLKGVI